MTSLMFLADIQHAKKKMAEQEQQPKARIIEFEPHDSGNPRNWSKWRKLLSWLPIVPVDLAVSFGASGYSPVTKKLVESFGISQEVGVLGLSIYNLALAFGPMINAPLSEAFGRLPIYTIFYGLSLPMYVGTALSKDVGTFLAFRFLTGLFQSVTIANLGGTIADLYELNNTGYPMSIFIWAGTSGSSIGFFCMSIVGEYYDWQDVFWALLGISSGLWLIMCGFVLYCGETRHSVIIRERARKAERDGEIVEIPEEHKQKSWRDTLNIQGRPFWFLGTEAIIIAGACFNGYLYGLSFLLNGAFTLVFGEGHDMSVLEVGLCFLGIAVGISIGPLTNIVQERYFQSRVRAGVHCPEARLRMGMVAGITFPISLFWFAWTTYSSINPIVPVLASALWGWSFYTLILMTYTYTEDSYGQFAASAMAGLGFVRNIAGSGFPLFGDQMFEGLGYQWAGSVLAFLALVLVPIPFLLHRYGKQLRKKSPWASQLMEDE